MSVTAALPSGQRDRIHTNWATVSNILASAKSSIDRSPAAQQTTRVTVGNGAASSAVYTDPRVASGFARTWSKPVGNDDAISVLMARNRGGNMYKLGDQWRGLGGALLTRFAKTGEDYTQALVDELPITSNATLDARSPAEQAQQASALLASRTSELSGIATNASTAALTIRTRSGRSVELTISLNDQIGGGAVYGMKVDLRASGAMTAEERAGVAKLANGLDRALDGLGRNDAVALDLSGLMHYDRNAIASIDLSANNRPYQPLGTFALHLGDDQQSIALNGSDGKMELHVDSQASLQHSATPQLQAAVADMEGRMDAAAERSHANATLVTQTKSAFEQLQLAVDKQHDLNRRKNANGDPADAIAHSGADATSTSATEPVLPAAVLATSATHPQSDPRVASQLTGLADFSASFGSETFVPHSDGATTEAGHVDDRFSQTTTTKHTADGGESVAQTVSEQLSADFLKASGDAMLDVKNGNYSATHIRDSSTATTIVDATPGHITRVLRDTDEQQMKTVSDFEAHRLVHRQSWTLSGSAFERSR